MNLKPENILVRGRPLMLAVRFGAISETQQDIKDLLVVRKHNRVIEKSCGPFSKSKEMSGDTLTFAACCGSANRQPKIEDADMTVTRITLTQQMIAIEQCHLWAQ